MPKKLLMTRLKLISPRLIVTGSISSSTLRTSGVHVEHPRSRKGVLRRSKADERELDRGPDEDPDRVGVDLVLLRERRRQPDQHGDDRQVPEERRDREDREAVVAVEDADDEPGDAEHHQDREQQPRQGDREVVAAALEAGREQRHDASARRG